MGYVNKKYSLSTIPAKRKQRIILTKTGEKAEHHMVIVADLPDKEVAFAFKKEMKKVIRRMEHLSKSEFSYELYLNLK